MPVSPLSRRGNPITNSPTAILLYGPPQMVEIVSLIGAPQRWQALRRQPQLIGNGQPDGLRAEIKGQDAALPSVVLCRKVFSIFDTANVSWTESRLM